MASHNLFTLPKKSRYYFGSLRLYKELFFYQKKYGVTFSNCSFDPSEIFETKNEIIMEVTKNKPERDKSPYPEVRNVVTDDFNQEDLVALLKLGIYDPEEDLHEIMNYTFFNIETSKQTQDQLQTVLEEYLTKYRNNSLDDTHYIPSKRGAESNSVNDRLSEIKRKIQSDSSNERSLEKQLQIQSNINIGHTTDAIFPFVHGLLLANRKDWFEKLSIRRKRTPSERMGSLYETSITLSEKVFKELGSQKDAIPHFELTGKKLKYEGSSIPLERGRNKVMRELWDNRQVDHVKEYERNGEPVHREVLQNAGNYSEASFRDALRKIKKRLRKQAEEGNFPPIKITNPKTNHYLLKIKYKDTSKI